MLSVDPRGIGFAFHRAGRTESKKTQFHVEIKSLYNLSMYHSQSNAGLAQAIIAAKLGLPHYSLMVYGINQLAAKASGFQKLVDIPKRQIRTQIFALAQTWY